jgi:hypothetical protein
MPGPMRADSISAKFRVRASTHLEIYEIPYPVITRHEIGHAHSPSRPRPSCYLPTQSTPEQGMRDLARVCQVRGLTRRGRRRLLRCCLDFVRIENVLQSPSV